MATILKAGNVATGAQITSDATGILEVRTGTGAGTTAITVGTNQAVTMGAVSSSSLTVNSNNISAVNSLGFRNRIINGDMRIDQRNNGASVSVSTSLFALDRWKELSNSGGGVFSVQRSTTAPAGFTNSALRTVTTADASVAAGEVYGFSQPIEGYNIADLAFGSASASAITVSFWVRSSLTGTYSVTIRNSAGTRSYPATYTISTANTFEYKTITIPGETSGAWSTDNSVGLEAWFDLGAGSNFRTTANAWASGNFVAATGSANWIGTSGATFYITGVQLEAGSVATPFERRDYGRELYMCQRYCRVFGASTTLCTALSFQTTTTSGSFMFGQTMRAVPTVTPSSVTAFQTTNGSGAAITSTNVGVFLSTADSTEIQIVVAAGLTVGQVAINRTGSGTLTISAEL